MPTVPAATQRPRAGRWLGGVCAGLAARWGVGAGGLRLAFVLGTLLGGLGVLVYAAAWLILPGEDEGGRGIVLLAQLAGALLGLLVLGALGAAATIFGFGWAVVALGAAVLVATLAGWARLGPAWALLPVAALVLPSVAMAVGRVRIEPSVTSRTVAPATLDELPGTVTSGLGLLTVDLRRTPLPPDGTIDLKIDAGVRRTLIALPHDRCVHVEVRRQVRPTALRIATTLLGRSDDGQGGVVLFGNWHYADRIRPHGRSARHTGPTLRVDFTSAGGGLIARDYPDDVNPQSDPDWPGYKVALEPRPDTAGIPRRAADALIRHWRERRAGQAASKQRIDGLMYGPCAQPELFP